MVRPEHGFMDYDLEVWERIEARESTALREEERRLKPKNPVPLLVRAMIWVAILSRGEAETCIRDYRAGLKYSGEAVNHFGGTLAVIQQAIKHRDLVRRMYKGEA